MTSIEWLIDQLKKKNDIDLLDIVIAKEIHKQEIINATNQIEFDDIDGMGISETITKGEQYYQETFKGGEIETFKKETLYTEEQVREAIKKTIECKIFRKHTEEEIIQSLKQPKKD